MPAKGKRKIPNPVARRVAAKRAQGKTVRAIAAEEGISPQAVSDVAKRQAALIARLTESHEHEIAAMYAIAMTEPGTGSDLTGMRTTAKLSEDGSHYLLNSRPVSKVIFGKQDDKWEEEFQAEVEELDKTMSRIN